MPPIHRLLPGALGSPGSGPAGRRLATGLMLAIASVAAGCAGPEVGSTALNRADYDWCNASGEVCSGWRGPGPFITGPTTPVGVWILPAADAARPQATFVPGPPVVIGDAPDFF